MAEAINGAYKEELIHGPGQGPWKNVDDVELATLSWVHWWNTERLHEYLGYVPPAEFEENWAKANACTTLSGSQRPATDAGDRTGPGQKTLTSQLWNQSQRASIKARTVQNVESCRFRCPA